MPPATNASFWPATPEIAALGDALFLQAYAALRVSPGARAYCDQHWARGAIPTKPFEPWRTGSSASLHSCLRTHILYDEHLAWHTRQPDHFRSWDV